MEYLTHLALGVGLAAACGFRVFVPLLVLSATGLAGWYSPAEELSWIASWPVLALFATATVVEVAAYYIPWADNLLDTIASPAALIAGVLASATVLGDLPPALQWTLAALAGGGSAGLVQASTVLLRGASTATTGGLGNPVIATIENVLSLFTAVFALIIPIAIAVALVVGMILVWRWADRRRRLAPASDGAPGAAT